MEYTQDLKVLEDYLSDITKIKNEFDSKRDKDRFNIFYALHKEHDEVNLHSRFISYLLDKNGGHKQGDFFARNFFEIVLKLETSFLDEYEVIPNEYNKKEFKEIDILLVNKSTSHAIIIENKIFAKDSNHKDKKEGYNGQLERYYNTILKGVPDEDNGLITHDYVCKKIDVFYLTLNPPKQVSFGVSKGNIPATVGVKELYYRDEIIEWLNSCIKEIQTDSLLENIINQYLILVKNMTKASLQEEELDELRKSYSKDLKTTQYIIDNFGHIKWRTVDEFLTQLEFKMKNFNEFTSVTLYPENRDERGKAITDLTHFNKDVNLGVFFSMGEDKSFYISTLNNLSWGVSNSTKWKNFEDEQLTNIRFSEFSTENTFNLIDDNNILKAVDKIIAEILKEKENNFEGFHPS